LGAGLEKAVVSGRAKAQQKPAPSRVRVQLTARPSHGC